MFESIREYPENLHCVYVPMSTRDRELLDRLVAREDTGYDVSKVTHIIICASEPDPEDADLYALGHNFIAFPAYEVDGEWFILADDPNAPGCIWFNTGYTKDEAYTAREIAVDWASRGRLYSDDEYSLHSEFYDHLSARLGWEG